MKSVVRGQKVLVIQVVAGKEMLVIRARLNIQITKWKALNIITRKAKHAKPAVVR